MPWIEVGDEKLTPGTTADLDRLFQEQCLFGVAVYQNKNHAVQATITGDSALLFYLDHKKGIGRNPQERLNREQA